MQIFFKPAVSYFALLLIVFLAVACKKSDTVPSQFPNPKDSVQTINRWILDSLYQYYYWNNHLLSITSLDGDPLSFFNSLKNSGDRYSWISNHDDVLAPGSSHLSYGFEYVIFADPSFSSTNMLGMILLVANGSNASVAGLKRGMYFDKVNGLAITSTNLSQVKQLLMGNGEISLAMVKPPDNSTWTSAGTKKVARAYFEDRPVYQTKMFEHGGKKAAYIFYNGFNEIFDNDLLTAFRQFKDKGATELIIDLRYNGGGSVASAAKFAALIANVRQDNVFGIYKGNSHYNEQNQTFAKVISSSTSVAGKDFNSLVGLRLDLNRVFIITTGNTISAAEMLINNLRPYLTVIQIGEKTAGKDMAATLISDKRNPKKIFWTIQPLVFKLYNSANRGDYGNGLGPDIQENELSVHPLSPLGSINDLLIAKANLQIFGTTSVTVNAAKLQQYETIENVEGRERSEVSRRRTGPVMYNSTDDKKEKNYPPIINLQ